MTSGSHNLLTLSHPNISEPCGDEYDMNIDLKSILFYYLHINQTESELVRKGLVIPIKFMPLWHQWAYLVRPSFLLFVVFIDR